jgi:hypothetical protein
LQLLYRYPLQQKLLHIQVRAETKCFFQKSTAIKYITKGPYLRQGILRDIKNSANMYVIPRNPIIVVGIFKYYGSMNMN